MVDCEKPRGVLAITFREEDQAIDVSKGEAVAEEVDRSDDVPQRISPTASDDASRPLAASRDETVKYTWETSLAAMGDETQTRDVSRNDRQLWLDSQNDPVAAETVSDVSLPETLSLHDPDPSYEEDAFSSRTAPAEVAVETSEEISTAELDGNEDLDHEHETESVPSKDISETALDVQHDSDWQSWSHLTNSVSSALDQDVVKNEIHILGTGILGKFVAHSLAGVTQPPKITILMHSPLSIQQWYDEGEGITLLKGGRLHTHRGFHVESAAVPQRTHPRPWGAAFGREFETRVEGPDTIIDTLIVTTPAKITVAALSTVRDRLRPTSTICLIHQGLGVVEDLNAILFPDELQRPTYVLASISSGREHLSSYTDRKYTVQQSGSVSLSCAKMPRESAFVTGEGPSITRNDNSWTSTAAYLMESLVRSPMLGVKPVAHKSFLMHKLRQVIFQSVVGPLSVLYDCDNRELLQSHHAKLTMQTLIEELSSIVLALPELQSLPNLVEVFSPKVLETSIRRVLRSNIESTSDMLLDVRSGTRTEVDFHNGYLLLRAAELGIKCPQNEMLFHVVKGKSNMNKLRRQQVIPLSEELSVV